MSFKGFLHLRVKEKLISFVYIIILCLKKHDLKISIVSFIGDWKNLVINADMQVQYERVQLSGNFHYQIVFNRNINLKQNQLVNMGLTLRGFQL